MKVILTIGEDYPDLRFLADPPNQPGVRTDNNVVGRFVAMRSFIDACARYGRLEYLLCPLTVLDAQTRSALAELLPMPLIDARDLQSILGSEPVVLHELTRHKVGRLASIAAQMAAFPTSITAQVHGLGTSTLVEELCGMMLHPLNGAETIICSSTATNAAMIEALNESRRVLAERGASVKLPRTEVIPLGIDTSALTPGHQAEARASLGLPPDRRILLFMGRLSASDKCDHAPLLRALASTHAQSATGNEPLGIADLCLVIAGNDRNDRSRTYVNELRSEIIRLGLTTNVDLRVNFPPMDRLKLYQAADAFVALSDSVGESFGLTVLEAMACGLPVIASDWSGYRDLVEDGVNGYRIPTYGLTDDAHADFLTNFGGPIAGDLSTAQTVAHSHASLCAAISKFRSMSRQQLDTLKFNAQQRAQRYDWSHIVPRYEDLWRNLQLLQKSRPAMTGPTTRRSTIFAHYPTRRLAPEAPCIAANHDPTMDQRTVMEAAARRGMIECGFHPKLAQRLLDTAHQVGPVSIDNLVSEEPEGSRALAAWHIAVLLKHGFLVID